MPPAVRLTFFYLYRHSDQNGYIEVTVAEVARAIFKSRQAVILALKRLEAVNLLKVKRRRGRGNGNIYVLNWAKPRKCKPLKNLQSSVPRPKTAVNDLAPAPGERLSWYRDLDEVQWSFADPGRLSKRASRKFRVLFEHYRLGGEEGQVAVGVIVKALRGQPREVWIRVYRRLRVALRDGVVKAKRWLAKGLRAFAAYIRTLVNQILAGKGLGWEALCQEREREKAKRRIQRTEELLLQLEAERRAAAISWERAGAPPSILDFRTLAEWEAAVCRWAEGLSEARHGRACPSSG